MFRASVHRTYQTIAVYGFLFAVFMLLLAFTGVVSLLLYLGAPSADSVYAYFCRYGLFSVGLGMSGGTVPCFSQGNHIPPTVRVVLTQPP